MTFISRAARYVLRKRARTAVLFIVLTIITASMLSATAVITPEFLRTFGFRP